MDLLFHFSWVNLVSHSCFWFYSGPRRSKFLNKKPKYREKGCLLFPIFNWQEITYKPQNFNLHKKFQNWTQMKNVLNLAPLKSFFKKVKKSGMSIHLMISSMYHQTLWTDFVLISNPFPFSRPLLLLWSYPRPSTSYSVMLISIQTVHVFNEAHPNNIKKCIKICTQSFITASAYYFVVFVWGTKLTAHLIRTYFELFVLINCIKLNFCWNSSLTMWSSFQMLAFGNFLKFLLINFELKFTFQNHVQILFERCKSENCVLIADKTQIWSHGT